MIGGVNPGKQISPYYSKPLEPQQAPDLKLGPYFNNMLNLASVQSPNYLDNFMQSYNNIMNGLNTGQTNAGLGQFNIGNAGLGQSGVGNAGLGQYDVGNAGMGMYDVGNSGLGTYDVGNAGTGQYTSDLLNNLASQVNTNLTNPNAGMAMGLAKDRISNAGLTAKRDLANQLASTGSMRNSGASNARMDQLLRDMARNESDQYRQIGLDTAKQATQDALATENLRGGFFENARGRELQNAGLGLSAYEGGKGRELQNAGLGQQSYADAMNRALQNAGLGQQSYADAMNRELQNAGMNQQGFENSKNRELQNIGLRSDTYSNAMARELQNAGLNQQGSNNYNQTLTSMLPALANMLQFQGTQDMNANAQSMQNWDNLNTRRNSMERAQWEEDQDQRKKMWNYNRDNAGWQNWAGGQSFNQQNPYQQQPGNPYQNKMW